MICCLGLMAFGNCSVRGINKRLPDVVDVVHMMTIILKRFFLRLFMREPWCKYDVVLTSPFRVC